MSHKALDRVKELASAGGTGTFSLTGAASGFRSFASQLTDGDSTWYCAVNGTEWEIGVGTKSGTTLARSSILSNSLGNTSAVNFSSAPTVFATLPAVGVGGVNFSAYQNASQSIGAGAVTKLNLQVKEFDTAGCFDNVTNYRFQPNVPGYYQIDGRVGFNSVSSSIVFVAIYKNGAEFKRGAQSQYAYGHVVSTLMYLNGSTDYVELWTYNGSAVTVAADPALTYLQGTLVAAVQMPKNVSGAQAAPLARAYLNANQTVTAGTWTKLTLNTKSFDPATAFDAAVNYRFQPAIAGYYEVKYAMRTAGTYGLAGLYKNGTAVSYSSYSSAVSGDLRCNGSDLVYLNGSSDYLELWGYTQGTTINSGSDTTYLAAHLVQTA